MATGIVREVAGNYVILAADDGDYAVQLAAIQRIRQLDAPLRLHVQESEADAIERPTLGMAYLRKGITWIPEYTLRLLDDETAELTLRGTLINEAEDIVRSDVNFVVGVPHFEHSDSMAPVAIGQLLRHVGSQIHGQVMNRAAIVGNDAFHTLESLGQDGAAFCTAFEGLFQDEVAGASDYAVYTKSDLTVRTGEKAIVTLFVTRIRYDHLYRWSRPAADAASSGTAQYDGHALDHGSCIDPQ